MGEYVQRMIEGLARVLAQIAAARKAGRQREAEDEIKEAAARFAGVDISLVDVLGPAAISAHLDDRFRLDALASLCEERAELEADRGDEGAAARWRGHAAGFRARG